MVRAPPSSCLLRHQGGTNTDSSHLSMFADQDSVQMLQRSSQIGEFYRMSPPAVWESSKRLPDSYMDIM